MYTVVGTPAFERDYRKLSMDLQGQVDSQIHRLGLDPHHPSLHTHKRRGEKDVWQARITRSLRVYFRMEGLLITLTHVGPHEK